MSDPLSIAASAIAVAQLGCAVAKGLYQIADDIGMAGLEVRLHAQEVDGFSKLLVRIQHTIDGPDLKTRRHEAAELRSHIGGLLDTCRKILQPMKDEIEFSLKPLLLRFHDSPTKLIQVALRIRWCFVSKGKIMFWREFLQAQHRLLDTSLLQAIYMSNSTARSTDEATSMLRASLENSYTSLKNPATNGSVRGRLLLAAPTGQTPRMSFDPELNTSLEEQEQDGREGTFSSGGNAYAPIDETSLVSLSTPPPVPEPDLAGMTDEERRAVRAATSIEMDGPTGQSLTQILLETDAAERHTLGMVTAALSGDRQKPNRDVRATREHIRSSLAWDLCGPDQIGAWSEYRKRVFRASRMRFDVQFEVPVIFLCSPNSTQGPLGPGTQIPLLFVKGTRESELETRMFSRKEKIRGPVYSNQRASWYILLHELHHMEDKALYSQRIALVTERKLGLGQAQQASERSWPSSSLVARWENRSYAVALQPRRQTWNALPANLARPCATTTLDCMVELAAMLGLRWRVFDRATGIYFAKGNGYSLSGRHEPGFGVFFEFAPDELRVSESFRDSEKRNLIPTRDIREMASGHILVAKAKDGQYYSVPPRTIEMGQKNSVADFLASLGCEQTAMSSQHDRQSHLFPVAFEIIGMLAQISYMPNMYLRRLPNPTTFLWNKLDFSIRKLLYEFQRLLVATRETHLLECVDKTVSALGNARFEPATGFLPLDTLSQLNRAIRHCDQFLLEKKDGKDGEKHRDLVLRFHFDEVLRFLDESRDQQTDSNVSDFEKFISASPETREVVLMNIYFSTILPRVVRAFDRVEPHHEGLAKMTWYTLVFRMLCWLLLHDFDKDDVQVGDLSKVFWAKIEVHIQ